MPVFLLAFPLLALVALLVAYGFAQIQHGQSTGFLNWLAGVAESSLFLVSPLAGEAIKLTSWLTHYLGKYFAATFTRGVQFFAGLNQYVRLVASVALEWPTDLFRVTNWLVWHEIPKLVKALPNSVTKIVHTTTRIVTRVERTVVRLPRLTKAQIAAALAAALPVVLRHQFGLLSWLRTHLKALAHLLAHPGISVPFPNVDWDWLTHGKIGRVTRDIQARLKRLERITHSLAAVGIVSAALTRLGVNWIRCNNVKRIGRTLCGLPSHLLNDVIGLLVDFFVLTNICTVVTLLTDAFVAVEGPLDTFVSQIGGALCGGDYQPPPVLPSVALSLPSTTAF